MTYKIDNNIPIPRQSRSESAAIAKNMKVGDSYLIEGEDKDSNLKQAQRLRAAINREVGCAALVRRDGILGNYRVWKIAKE